MPIIINTLKNQNKKGFCCGTPALDTWLKKQARQDASRGYASVFAASFEEKPDLIIGYYALSAASINLDLLPVEIAEKLPRYPNVPAIRLGRLAVDKKLQGNNIGRMLLLDALRRSCTSEIAWAIFLVEAKNEKVRSFYEKFYFLPFRDNNLNMWLKRKQAEMITALL